MIVAITSVRNEADIIAKTVTHHLAVGADWVIASDGHSTDGTGEILEALDRVSVFDQDGPFDQAVEMLTLTRHAKEMGADWVVPFDADEFWCDLTRLNELPASYTKVYARVFAHADWDRRHTDAKPLPKVAFTDATSIAWGQHEADVPVWGNTDATFEIRELQYQSFGHFLAKIDKARDLYESYDFPAEYGSHMRALVAMSDEQRVAEWARLCAIPTVHDPIPYRGAR